MWQVVRGIACQGEKIQTNKGILQEVKYFIKVSNPLPLTSKGEKNQEKNIRSMKTGGVVITRGVCMFPSMTKGENVE